MATYKELDTYLQYEQPTKYIVNTQDYSDEYSIPVLTAGKTFILGYTNETEGIFHASKEPVIIFDDFTSSIQYVNFDFKVKSSAMKILHKINDEDNLKYLFYAMKCLDFTPFSHKRLWISEYSKLKIQHRSSQEQNNIASELNNIEQAIKVKQEQLKALDELIQSRFTEMFENHNFPLVYPNEIAETIIVGGDKPSQTSPIKDTQYKYAIYSNGEKNLGLIGFSTSARVTKTAITVSARGTIGLAVIRKEPFTPIVRLITLIPNNKVNAIYLTFYLNREREKGLGTSIKQLTLPMFSKKRILLSPLPLQNQFAEFVKKVEKAKEIVKIQIRDLQELLFLKMDEYFK